MHPSVFYNCGKVTKIMKYDNENMKNIAKSISLYSKFKKVI